MEGDSDDNLEIGIEYVEYVLDVGNCIRDSPYFQFMELFLV